jgi:HK97 family phage major capsid protein
MKSSKELRNEQIRLESQMETFIATWDKNASAGKERTAQEREQWEKMAADHNALDTQIAEAKKQEAADAGMEQWRARLAANNKPNNPGGISDLGDIGELTQEFLAQFRRGPKAMRARQELYKKDAHERAFHNYLCQPGAVLQGTGGMDEMEAALLQKLTIQNAQGGGTGSQGGYLIPTGFSDLLEQAMLWFGGIDGVVGEFPTATGNPLPWPTVNDTMNKGRIIGQNIQVTETDFIFNQVTLNAYIGSSDIVLIPLALLEDSYFDMDALAATLLGIRLGRLLNWKCTVGTGTAEPTGIVTAAVAAGAVTQLANGNTASIAYTNLVGMQHAVDPAYRYNAATRWMFSDTMLKLIKLLVDGNNRPLWQPGLTASFQEGAGVDITVSKPKILDTPYIINQDMAVPAANAYSLLYGDMSKFKLRRVAGGITVLRLIERYADYLQIGLTAFMRFDSNLIDAGTHPIAVMQQSAA